MLVIRLRFVCNKIMEAHRQDSIFAHEANCAQILGELRRTQSRRNLKNAKLSAFVIGSKGAVFFVSHLHIGPESNGRAGAKKASHWVCARVWCGCGLTSCWCVKILYLNTMERNDQRKVNDSITGQP